MSHPVPWMDYPEDEGGKMSIDHASDKRRRVYRAWMAMRSRCNNPNTVQYPRYGGRGIKVCARWDSFAMFLEDMGEPPDGATLDRVNVNGDYEPCNCRWASRYEQNNNARSNHRVTIDGRTQTVSQWAREMGLNPQLIYSRINRGTEPKQALLLGRRPYPWNKKS